MASVIGDKIVYSLATANSTLSTTESTIPLDTTVGTVNADTYTTSSGVITVKETGLYMVINNLVVDRNTSGSSRTSGESFLHINNTLVTGAYTDGYLRRASAADEFADTGYGIYELTTNDTVEARQLRINSVGSDGRILGNATTYATANTSLTLIRLDDSAPCCILEGAAGDTSSLTASDSLANQTWSTQTRLDTGYTHTSGSASITIDDAGKYLVMYSNSWSRSTVSTTRTGVYERLALDGTAIGGTWDNNYIRGNQSGELIMRGNNSSATIIETTTANEVLTLGSYREAGAITCSRLPLKSRLCIYKLNDVKSFRVESSSTQSVGSTTEVTMTYDSSAWTDTGFSLSANQITCADASDYLFLTSVHSDTGVTRNEPWQWFRVGGTKVNHGTGSGYNRNSGSTQRVSPNVGIVAAVTASQAVDVRNDSLSSNGTSPRVANTGAFAGLDLATLAPAGGTAYSLTCDAGGFTLTGIAADLTVERVYSLDMGVGSYNLTGSSATLSVTKVYSLACDSGNYSVIGSPVGFILDDRLAIGAGSYTLTGNDISFVLTRSYSMSADAGSYALVGSDANLTSANVSTINADSGSYTVSGSNAGLTVNKALSADSGSYTLTGQDVPLNVVSGFVLLTGFGVVALNGGEATMVYSPASEPVESAQGGIDPAHASEYIKKLRRIAKLSDDRMTKRTVKKVKKQIKAIIDDVEEAANENNLDTKELKAFVFEDTVEDYSSLIAEAQELVLIYENYLTEIQDEEEAVILLLG